MNLFADLPPLTDGQLPPFYVYVPWLRQALSKEEAAIATELPADLVKSLYRDILTFGPAAALIAEAYDKQQEVEDADNGEAWRDEVKALGRMVQRSPVVPPAERLMARWSQDTQQETIEEFIQQWADDAKTAVMEQQLNMLGSRGLGIKFRKDGVVERHDYAVGLNTLYWLLNGQYIFSTALVSACASMIPSANSILRGLGMEPLAGLFRGHSLTVGS